MAIFELDEEEMDHIYGALLAGNEQWKGIEKKLAKMNRDDDTVTAQIQVNARLRKQFNPRAEEEARDAARAKDPRQMDIEDEDEDDDEKQSSGETGGMTRTRVKTPAVWTNNQLRDRLVDAGYTLALSDIRGLTPVQREALVVWIGQLVAAQTLGGTVPDEPEAIYLGMANDRVMQLVDMGPHSVVTVGVNGSPDSFEVMNAAREVLETYPDGFDAGIRAARLNLEVLRNSDITKVEIDEWVEKGPWGVEDHDGRWIIRAGSQTEIIADMDTAFAAAARYNRSIAKRAEAAEWTEKPVHVDPTGEQELIAAAEHDAAVEESTDSLWDADGAEDEEDEEELDITPL